MSALFPTLDKKSLRNLGSFFKKQTRFFDYNRGKLQDEKGKNDVRKTRQRRRGNGRGGLMKAGLLVLMILVFVLGGMKLAGAGPFFDGYREMEGGGGRLSAGYDSGSSDTEFLLPSGDGDIPDP